MSAEPAPKEFMKPGWYFVGYITPASVAIMPPGVNFAVGTSMSNTKPLGSRAAAQKRADSHLLRDITIHQIK